MQHPTAIEKRAMNESANILALQQMLVDVIRRIMKKRRKGFYLVNNLRRANDFMVYAVQSVNALNMLHDPKHQEWPILKPSKEVPND